MPDDVGRMQARMALVLSATESLQLLPGQEKPPDIEDQVAAQSKIHALWEQVVQDLFDHRPDVAWARHRMVLTVVLQACVEMPGETPTVELLQVPQAEGDDFHLLLRDLSMARWGLTESSHHKWLGGSGHTNWLGVWPSKSTRGAALRTKAWPNKIHKFKKENIQAWEVLEGFHLHKNNDQGASLPLTILEGLR